MNYDPTNAGGFQSGRREDSQQAFLVRVFNWMFAGLLTSGVAAYLVASNPLIVRTLFSNSLLPIVLVIGLFALVWNLSANILKMSPQAAASNFFIYSALNGVLLSTVLLVYTSSSIVNTFGVTAVTFGVMAIYGATTKVILVKSAIWRSWL
jgi:FtsH-binding integral membrane protein